MASDSHVPNPSTWSLIVDRTLFMLQQEENRYLNHSTIIKALIKEVNSLLHDIVNTLQDCCNPIGPDEECKEDEYIQNNEGGCKKKARIEGRYGEG